MILQVVLMSVSATWELQACWPVPDRRVRLDCDDYCGNCWEGVLTVIRMMSVVVTLLLSDVIVSHLAFGLVLFHISICEDWCFTRTLFFFSDAFLCTGVLLRWLLTPLSWAWSRVFVLVLFGSAFAVVFLSGLRTYSWLGDYGCFHPGSSGLMARLLRWIEVLVFGATGPWADQRVETKKKLDLDCTKWFVGDFTDTHSWEYVRWGDVIRDVLCPLSIFYYHW